MIEKSSLKIYNILHRILIMTAIMKKIHTMTTMTVKVMRDIIRNKMTNITIQQKVGVAQLMVIKTNNITYNPGQLPKTKKTKKQSRLAK